MKCFTDPSSYRATETYIDSPANATLDVSLTLQAIGLLKHKFLVRQGSEYKVSLTLQAIGLLKHIRQDAELLLEQRFTDPSSYRATET